MATTDSSHDFAGVMDASYASDRIHKQHIRYRYRVRAAVAVAAYREHHPRRVVSALLDLGAAEGRTMVELRHLLDDVQDVVGVEYSKSLIDAAPPLPEGTRLISGNAMDLPAEIEERSFDLCTALAVLEHLPDARSCLAEAFRVLKPGGVVVATCPNPFWDELAGRLGLVADEHHEDEVDHHKMARWARQVGFERVTTRRFMWVVTGLLPYLGVALAPHRSLAIDRLVERVPLLKRTFVNQLLVAVKPLS